MSAQREASETVFDRLRERVPEELISTRKQGGANLRYIEWHEAANLLDERAPGWSSEIREVGAVAGKIFLRVALTIDGVTRENVGYEDENSAGYGDPFSNAYAMAFKRAAALFGLGRHLYDKEDLQNLYKERAPAPLKAVPSPMQSTDEWPCGEAIKRNILDLEAELEAAGVSQKEVRDRLEIQFGKRNPAHIDTASAQRYQGFLRRKLEAIARG